VQYRRQSDLFSWSDASRGVTVDLTQGTGTASGFGADRIRIQPRMGVLGSPYADTIRGSADADLLNGGNGDDVIRGGDGADRLYGESRDGTGADTVVGGIGDDLIGSYAGRDELRGGDDEDFIEAYGTAPVVVNGGPGRDQVAQAITRASGLATSGGGDRDVVSLYGDHLEAISPRVRFAVDLRDGTTRADLPSSSPVGTIGGYEEYRLVGLLRWSFHGTPEADRVWAITGGELHAVTYAGNDWVGGSQRR
jgi:Ca2+-binding RTX toxin-like protein